MTPSPADVLQYGALGLLALGCVAWFSLTAWVIKRTLKAQEEFRRELRGVREAMLILRDPSIRSYLDELRSTEEKRERDTERPPWRGGAA